jgi:hypothetical protein
MGDEREGLGDLSRWRARIDERHPDRRVERPKDARRDRGGPDEEGHERQEEHVPFECAAARWHQASPGS